MKTLYRQLLLTMTSVLLLSCFCSELLAECPQNSTRADKNDSPCSGAFSVHDGDGDGSLSREEYRQFVTKIEQQKNSTGRPMRRFSPPLRFEEIDSNNDNYLSEDELITALNKRLQKHRHYRYRDSFQRQH